MTVTRTEAPPDVIKTPTGYSRSSMVNVRAMLAEVKADAESDGNDGWYDLGVWENPSTAGKYARGISRANTDLAKKGDPTCPPGRWEAGVTKVPGGGLIKVRYLGAAVEDEVDGEDPFS